MSILLAKLVGPIFVVAGFAMLTAPRHLQTVTADFLKSSALVFISGVLAMLGGLAIINSHNLWVADWPVILTLLGWGLAIGGGARIALPGLVAEVGAGFLARPVATRIAGAVWGALGLFLAYKGYAAAV